MNTTKKTASLHTLGCRLNQSETAIIAKKLQNAGYDIVPFGKRADLGIINTCTVTAMADAKSRNAIRSFRRKNPKSFLAVAGCYPQTDHKAISRIPGIDLIIGNQEKMNMLEHIGLKKTGSAHIVRGRILKDDFTLDTIGQSEFTTRANLKIQDGCDFMCSFCIIPFARGRSRSRDVDDLIREATILADRGTKEIVLTGINLGSYAYKGISIVGVIDKLNTIPGIERIRISSIEPTTVPEALFDYMNDRDHALLPHLHIPLQSGSDKILKLMRRKYTAREFVGFIERAHSAVKNICIGTDIMVGFPGETKNDFEETHKVLEQGPISYSHVFTFSSRSGTYASKIPDKIHGSVKASRSSELRKLSAKKRKKYNKSFLGKILPVLFEEKKGGFWTGYTCNYIRVLVKSRQDLSNRIINVKPTKAAKDSLEAALIK